MGKLIQNMRRVLMKAAINYAGLKVAGYGTAIGTIIHCQWPTPVGEAACSFLSGALLAFLIRDRLLRQEHEECERLICLSVSAQVDQFLAKSSVEEGEEWKNGCSDDDE